MVLLTETGVSKRQHCGVQAHPGPFRREQLIYLVVEKVADWQLRIQIHSRACPSLKRTILLKVTSSSGEWPGASDRLMLGIRAQTPLPWIWKDTNARAARGVGEASWRLRHSPTLSLTLPLPPQPLTPGGLLIHFLFSNAVPASLTLLLYLLCLRSI